MKSTCKKLILISLITILPVAALGYFSIKKSGLFGFCTVEFDTSGGTPIEPIRVEYGKKISQELVTHKDGYILNNWVNGDHVWRLDKDVVTKDISLKAIWDIATYQLTYDFDGGEYSGTYQTWYNKDSNFELIRPNKDNSVFCGWFVGENKRIDSIKPNSIYGDLNLKAAWVDNLYIESENLDKGSILTYLSETNKKIVTVKNLPVDNKYHLFRGWYDEDGNLLSTEENYDVLLKDGMQTKIYSRFLSDEEETTWNNIHGINPVLVDGGKFITYGMYPQTNINDQSLIATLEKQETTKFSNYVCLNNEYYLCSKSLVLKDDSGKTPDYYRFDNGDAIEDQKFYWFKVEPIRWRVINNHSKYYFVISEKLLDVCRFNIFYTDTISDGVMYPANAYNKSYIRKWLNGEFYRKAFYFNNQNLISNEVDMSSSTTSNPEQSKDFINVIDKIFLFSYKDYVNPEYGFSNNSAHSPTRYVEVTDYNRTTGCTFGYNGGKYCGYYWTRSMSYSESNTITVSKVNKNGVINTTDVKDLGISNQPVTTILLG